MTQQFSPRNLIKQICCLACLLFFVSNAAAQTQFVAADGLTAEKLIEIAQSRRADLLSARQRVVIAEAKILQARARPNPTLDAEYGTPRILGGDAESDLSIGVSQIFETGGKRSKRIAVAEIELQQIRAEVLALERRISAEIRSFYARAAAAARQLEILDELTKTDAELVRVTEARFKEGDVAPLELNLVKVESDRLKIQIMDVSSELETAILELKTLAGFDTLENLQIAPQAERPPRLDLSLAELINNALQNRGDLQAARIAEDLGTARINLAKAGTVPDVAASLRFSRTKEIFDFPASVGGSLIDKSNALTFGVSVEIPVFNRRKGEIAAATAEQILAVRNREFVEAAIKRDVAVAFRKYRAASEKLVLYSTQILPRSKENLFSVREAYKIGEFSIFEVIAEQRSLTENVAGFNAAFRDYYAALIEIETATGAPLPATAFAPAGTSVLPEKSVVPNQIELKNFLQLLQKPDENK